MNEETAKFTGMSLIVPVVNETESFRETMKIIFDSCNAQDLEEIIICLADFGSDECKAIAREFEETSYETTSVPVRIYLQHGSFEQAVKDTIKMLNGSHYMYQSADLEEDPHLVNEFIVLAKENPEKIITASRFLKPEDKKNLPILKKLLYPAFRRCVKVIYGGNLTDSTLVYRCVPCEYVKDLPLSQKSYAVLFEMMLAFLIRNYEIIEVPLFYGKRTDGKSNVRFFKEGLRFVKVLFAVRLHKNRYVH